MWMKHSPIECVNSTEWSCRSNNLTKTRGDSRTSRTLTDRSRWTSQSRAEEAQSEKCQVCHADFIMLVVLVSVCGPKCLMSARLCSYTLIFERTVEGRGCHRSTSPTERHADITLSALLDETLLHKTTKSIKVTHLSVMCNSPLLSFSNPGVYKCRAVDPSGEKPSSCIWFKPFQAWGCGVVG